MTHWQETKAIQCFFVPHAHLDIEDHKFGPCKPEMAGNQYRKIKPTLSWNLSGQEGDVTTKHMKMNRAATHPAFLRTKSSGAAAVDTDKHGYGGQGNATNGAAAGGNVAKTDRRQPLHWKPEDEFITL